MEAELGKDAKIPNLWRTSALLDMCPKDVQEQMMMKLDEIAVNYENFKAKVMSNTTNKTEQTRRRQKEMYVPMEETMLVATSHKRKTWKMWTWFEGVQCVTIAG